MIRTCFTFLDGIHKGMEKSIIRQVNDWDGFLKNDKIHGISRERKLYYNRQISKAMDELYKFNSAYFNILPQAETWRLYKFFRDEACFLDIETSGFDGYITVFGFFDGISTKTMVKGINLDYIKLKEALKKYKLIVTFNGASFDIPFIKKRVPDLLPNVPHLDLKHACGKVGLKGGLKQIEKELGIKRGNIISDFDGGDALRLWRMYLASGDEYYIKLLVEYNEEDIINLKTIADIVYARLKNEF